MGTPSQTGQEDVLRVAYEDAGLFRLAGQVCGGAMARATRAGDPVELKAIAGRSREGAARLIGRSSSDRRRPIGATRTAAAGLAGVDQDPPSFSIMAAFRRASIGPSQIRCSPRGNLR